MLGYHNYWQVLNSKDYGIPQNRQRVFVVSVKGFVFPEGKELALRLKDMLEDEVDEKYFLSQKGVNYVTHEKRLEKNYTNLNADCSATLTAKGQSNWTGSFVSDNPQGVIVDNRGGEHRKTNGYCNNPVSKRLQGVWKSANECSNRGY